MKHQPIYADNINVRKRSFGIKRNSCASRGATSAKALAAPVVALIILVAAAPAAAAAPAVASYSLNSDMPGTGHSFSYVHITDLHVGQGAGDYGAAGYDDSPPPGDVGSAAQNLRSTVDWINANYASMSVRFAVVTGDITDSAERSEFMKAKEILDTLLVPYVPLPGNHDIWPYTATAECNNPVGDQYFNEVFGSQFDALKGFFPTWDDGTRSTPIWNGEADSLAGPNTGCDSYFQNFAFDYAGYHLVCCDFNSRDHEGGGMGSLSQADLFDSGLCQGTWAWFEDHFNGCPDKAAENVIIGCHEPIMLIEGRAFDASEYETVTSFLAGGYNETYVGLAFTGHQHVTAEYDIKYGSETICPAVMTAGNRDGAGNAREIKVWSKTSEKDASGLILYTEGGLSGRGEFFAGDDSSLAESYIGSDTASSARVVRGGRGVLYEDDTFKGRSKAVESDTGDLSSGGFDDITSSLAVEAVGGGPDPEITSVQPDCAKAGATVYPVEVVGDHFEDGVTVLLERGGYPEVE
ncbi:MAG: metallophosphoesterase, partial [Actinobacteria bacterium]|nr:metallophosphoesterase [Actinomycetota bacterium]